MNFFAIFFLKEKKETKDIWDIDDVPEGIVYDTKDDPRIQPDYDISYKQKITTEDIFLQMGNKTPATASCEEMMVIILLRSISEIRLIFFSIIFYFYYYFNSKQIKIQLPEEKLSDIDLDVTENNFLDCRSSKQYVFDNYIFRNLNLIL